MANDPVAHGPQVNHAAPITPDETGELTVDELAARAHMTVRNVRAYASRGLIDAPRLEGRTGYYSLKHLQRLQLIRQLLDRGYTLAAVEKAVQGAPGTAAGHALDLIELLDLPADDGIDEIMSRDDLAALAGVPRGDGLIDAMEKFGLVAWIEGDHEHVHLLQPTVVRTGAAAVAMGLSPETVIALFPLLQARLNDIANAFVHAVAEEIIDPFLTQGLPEDQWPSLLASVESLIPIASQVTLGMFRNSLQESIDRELEAKIGLLGGGKKR